MGTENNFVFTSLRLIAYVDFLKWTSTLGDGAIRGIETPMRGVQISPALTELFGFARDELGLMFVMDAREAPWLEHLPLACAIHGYDDASSLLLVTQRLSVSDIEVPPLAIEIHVPLARHADLNGQTLLGLCLVRDGKPVRVGRLVPLFDPHTWREHEASTRANRAAATGSFFAGA
jgi:hypothetical protein